MEQPQFTTDAPDCNGRDMGDNALGKLGIFFSTGSHYGECTKCSIYFCNLPKVNSLTAHQHTAQQLIENRYLIV